MISGSSLLSALVIFIIVMLPLSRLRERDAFLEAGGGSVLLVVFALAAIRLLMPLETPFTYSVHSWRLLGAIQRFLRANPVIIWSVAVGWGLGVVPAAGREIRSLCGVYRFCRSLDAVNCPRIQAIAKNKSIRCRVMVSPKVSVPFVVGLFRHTIYMPELSVSERRLELILLHEHQHIRSHDAWIKFLYGVLKVAMWWFRPVQRFQEDLDALLELWCDRRMLAGLSEEDQSEYAEMILDMAKRTVAGGCAPVSALGGSGEENSSGIAEQRLKILVKSVGKPRRKIFEVAGCCAALVVFLASYLVVVQPAGAPSSDGFEAGKGIIYSEEYEAPGVGESSHEAFILNGPDGKYQLYVDYHFIKYLTYEETVSDEYRNLRVFEENQQK